MACRESHTYELYVLPFVEPSRLLVAESARGVADRETDNGARAKSAASTYATLPTAVAVAIKIKSNHRCSSG